MNRPQVVYFPSGVLVYFPSGASTWNLLPRSRGAWSHRRAARPNAFCEGLQASKLAPLRGRAAGLLPCHLFGLGVRWLSVF
jgi:hypothetical protein